MFAAVQAGSSHTRQSACRRENSCGIIREGSAKRLAEGSSRYRGNSVESPAPGRQKKMSLTQVAIAAVEQRKRQERHAVTHAPAREAVPPSHAEVHRVPRPKLGVRALTRAFFERTHTKDLDEISEDDDDTPRPFCIIWPDSNFRLGWDLAILLLIVYNVFSVPVAICFSLELEPTHPWFWVELLFDVIFLIDCFGINFNTAVVTEAGLSTDRCVIAKKYLSFWFWVDFPSSLPLVASFKIVAFAQGADEGDESGNMPLLRAIKLIRLARILKLIRLMKAAKIYRLIEEELDINASVLKLFKMIFAVLFICHLMGCTTYWIATGTEAAHVFGMFRPPEWWGCLVRSGQSNATFLPDPTVEYELVTGKPRAPAGFCADGEFTNKLGKGSLYVWVLYWTVTTMTTIGYGDISPRTPIELCITIVVQLIGAVLFGWIIGSIATVVADFNQYETAYKMRMESIKAYLEHKRVPRDMRVRVRKFCTHYYRRKGVLRETWEMLPPRLRRELLKFEHKEFFARFPKLCEEGCHEIVHRLAECVRPVHVSAGAHFVDAESDPCTEIAFVAEGEMHVLHHRARGMLARMQEAAPGVLKSGVDKSCCSHTGETGTTSRSGEATPRREQKSDASDASTVSFGDASTSAPATASPLLPTLTRRNSMSASRYVGSKYPGSWFGHVELLDVYEDSAGRGVDSSMTSDVLWQHSYKAKIACELLLLVKDDLFLLLDEYPYLRDLLRHEPQVDPPLESPSKRRAKSVSNDALASATDAAAAAATDADAGADADKASRTADGSAALAAARGFSPLVAAAKARGPALEPIFASQVSAKWDDGSDDGKDAARNDSAPSGARLIIAAAASASAGSASAGSASAGNAPAGNAPAPLCAANGEGKAPAAGEEESAEAKAATAHRLLTASNSRELAACGGTPGCRLSGGERAAARVVGKAPKAPSALTPDGLQPLGASPTGRAHWQKLRRMRGELSTLQSSARSSTSSRRTSSDLPNGGHVQAETAGWFKQRIACELLGDEPRAPWELEEDVLFERLSLLVSQARAIVHAQQQPQPQPQPEQQPEQQQPVALLVPPGAVAETPPPTVRATAVADASEARPFELLQLLLSMQQTVRQNADAVKSHLAQAEAVRPVQAVSAPASASATARGAGAGQ